MKKLLFLLIMLTNISVADTIQIEMPVNRQNELPNINGEQPTRIWFKASELLTKQEKQKEIKIIYDIEHGEYDKKTEINNHSN